MKSAKDVAVLKLIAIFDSRLIFQHFLNLVYQICFEILIYYNSINKIISISIKLAHFLLMFVLRVHFFQLLSIALSFHSFSLSLTIIFIHMTIFFIFTFAASRYSFFIICFCNFIYLRVQKIDFVMFHFCIYSERKVIKIILIEIFDYQIVKNKNFDECQYENLNFQLLIKRLTKKKVLMQSNL